MKQTSETLFLMVSVTVSEICLLIYICVFLLKGIAPHCLDSGTVRSVTVEKFHGVDWEESMQKHQTISNKSKDLK